MDGVQCGHYRTGCFQSFQRILEGAPDGAGFLPDGVSMAKSLGGGFPIGAFWVREPFADLLGPGTHASTFGGTPLACAVALRVLEVIERERLADNARAMGEFLLTELQRLATRFPGVVAEVRGLGLMIGIELQPALAGLAGGPARLPSLRFVDQLHAAGVLAIPAGPNVVRLLPPLNLSRDEAVFGLERIESVIAKVAG
jgi:acetylornithine aminotransferase/acetylornithine/N-succinyldiaminopimelate aminotransferase